MIQLFQPVRKHHTNTYTSFTFLPQERRNRVVRFFSVNVIRIISCIRLPFDKTSIVFSIYFLESDAQIKIDNLP